MTTNDPKLQPLHKTLHALKEISSSLKPFLKLLRDDDNEDKTADEKNKKDASSKNESPSKHKLTPHKRAEAEAAVALTMGTLRYMGARLKGLDRGRKKGDPLRKELDQIRGLLVSLRKIESEEEKKKKKNTNDSSSNKEDETQTANRAVGSVPSDSNKSKRVLDDAESNKKKKQKTSN